MIRGAGVIALLILNLVRWGTPVVLVGIVRFAVQMAAPRSRLRTRIILYIVSLAERWAAGNNTILQRFVGLTWDIEGVPDTLPKDGRFLIISNHVSLVDIVVLFRIFQDRMAFIRFFLKQELIWFPILGQACWALEFPFMKRYTSEYLQQHPEKRGEDLATTRRACQRYRHVPVAIANFVEGTRFSEAKRRAQDSPYRHLLRPRVGGISYVLASLGDQLDAVIDVTIAYPGPPGLWPLVTGKLNPIRVRARQLEVPEEFITAAITEPGAARDRFKSWINQRWKEKDDLLEEMRAAAGGGPGSISNAV
jgi:1-acyl-sn-glycerol-3-phosphate acyltransferase